MKRLKCKKIYLFFSIICSLLFLSVSVNAVIPIQVTGYTYEVEQTQFTLGYEYKKIDNKPLINGFKKNELFEKKIIYAK